MITEILYTSPYFYIEDEKLNQPSINKDAKCQKHSKRISKRFETTKSMMKEILYADKRKVYKSKDDNEEIKMNKSRNSISF